MFKRLFWCCALLCLCLGTTPVLAAATPVVFQSSQCNFSLTLPAQFTAKDDIVDEVFLATNPQGNAVLSISSISITMDENTSEKLKTMLATYRQSFVRTGAKVLSETSYSHRPPGLTSHELVVEIPKAKTGATEKVTVIYHFLAHDNHLIAIAYSCMEKNPAYWLAEFRRSFDSYQRLQQ